MTVTEGTAVRPESASTYIVATHEAPTIVCPDWCVIPAAEHVEDLPNWEGRVIHRSSDRELAPGFIAGIATVATPAGSLVESACVHLYTSPGELSPTEALAAGRALAALAEEALR